MKISMINTGLFGVNTYYALCEKTKKGFLVDPGGHSDSLSKQIKADEATIEYIILTHSHIDHIGGVKDYQREFPQAKLVIGTHEIEMLSSPLNKLLGGFGSDVKLQPDILVNDGDTLTVGELELTILSTPGHSPGGICILVENNLFSGDTLFRQSIGRTDFPGSSYEALIGSIREKLFVLPDDTRVLPGHMDETVLGYEKRNNPFLR